MKGKLAKELYKVCEIHGVLAFANADKTEHCPLCLPVKTKLRSLTPAEVKDIEKQMR